MGRDVDVMISHPQLVAIGLDLFNFTRGRHNFNNLSFYQAGYNLFTIRQASRRGYRIGQPLDCTVRYFYYAATMQAIAMNLMSRKAMAAMRLEEGSVSEEGLAAMGGGSDQLALVNAISEVIDPADIQRNWGRVKSGQRGEKRKKPIVIVPETIFGENGKPAAQCRRPARISWTSLGVSTPRRKRWERSARNAGTGSRSAMAILCFATTVRISPHARMKFAMITAFAVQSASTRS